MKSGTTAVTLAGFVVVAGIAYAFVTDGGMPAYAGDGPAAKADAAPAKVVHVDELADKPERYKGEIVLMAAVARVNRARGVFSAIDYREFVQCHELDCAKHYLPVKFDGPLPKPETLIRMTGKVVKTEKGLVFEAKRLDVTK
ncbi:MAG: hypothetical protein KatS3mg108_0721 [Isosphaeraceae bacterium]|jgi:hypothetical protein|nr:MAG: hypothetical protein KatS3mg108_0721 [Isosphaeraceae bacterium]